MIAVEIDGGEVEWLVAHGLTPGQARVYMLVFETIRRTGRRPTLRQIADAGGHREDRCVQRRREAAQRVVRALVDKGWLGRDPDEDRGWELRKGPDGLPFAGFRYEGGST